MLTQLVALIISIPNSIRNPMKIASIWTWIWSFGEYTVHTKMHCGSTVLHTKMQIVVVQFYIPKCKYRSNDKFWLSDNVLQSLVPSNLTWGSKEYKLVITLESQWLVVASTSVAVISCSPIYFSDHLFGYNGEWIIFEGVIF